MHYLRQGFSPEDQSGFVDVVVSPGELLLIETALDVLYDTAVRTPLVADMGTVEGASLAMTRIIELRQSVKETIKAAGMEPSSVPGFKD